MLSETYHQLTQTPQPIEKMITGALEGKLIATKILLKQGMDWSRIAELMDLTEEQITCVARDFH